MEGWTSTSPNGTIPPAKRCEKPFCTLFSDFVTRFVSLITGLSLIFLLEDERVRGSSRNALFAALTEYVAFSGRIENY
jgi:hypothetical protein